MLHFKLRQDSFQGLRQRIGGPSLGGTTTFRMPQWYPNLPHEVFTFGYCVITPHAKRHCGNPGPIVAQPTRTALITREKGVYSCKIIL
jgi:hypothetical protein